MDGGELLPLGELSLHHCATGGAGKEGDLAVPKLLEPSTFDGREGAHRMMDPAQLPHNLTITALKKNMRPTDESSDQLLVVLERTASLSRLLSAHWNVRRDCADLGLPQPSNR